MDNQTDLMISDGDIVVENGQFKLHKNEELIQEAVLRRIKTPLNSYSVYSISLKDSQVTVLDSEYGNISYELTAMDSQLVQEKLRDGIRDSLALEPRITVYDISLSNDIIEGISTVISYYINGEQDSIQRITL